MNQNRQQVGPIHQSNMETEIQKLQRQIDELQKQLDTLKSSTTIPFDIDKAFRKRFDLDNMIDQRELDAYIITSSKSATSENQAVDEAGAATYSVLKKPDGFVEIVISGTTYYLPYFT